MNPNVATGIVSQCTVGGADIRSLVSKLDYFESIYETAASSNISVNDASGFHQQAKLKGGEDVELAFGNREGSTIRMKFKTGIIGDRTRVKDNQDYYELTCVPQEFLENNQKEVAKAYVGEKLSEMVKKWHEDYTKDSITIKKDLTTNEESEGNATYYGTGRSPVTAIRWAAKEAKSAKAKASNYVYYQDREGYHFKTIDSMLSEGDKFTFSYAQQNIGAAGSDPQRNIIAFEQQKDFNTVESSFNGADSDHWYYFDPTTGKTGGGSKRDGAGDTSHTGKNQITQKQKTARGERFNFVIAPGASKSKFRDARDPKISENKRTVHEHGANSSAATQLDNLIMHVRVPGDVEYKPGIKVKLNIPANQEEGELDNRSGSYLVTSVRHVLYKDGKDMKYECVLECKSDSQSKG
jgi:phosphopantetheinyl transferase (holo-ACP synthase)